ncbi:hypothetical protein [Melissospora conviva]|uniref:hypothetical protein n=1 Tax=Melissospora conviva TaxID=3388432 RepID=UPI003C1F66E5
MTDRFRPNHPSPEAARIAAEIRATDQTPIDPARVLAALDALGWPDDRTATEYPAGALYEAAESAIRAADKADDRDQRIAYLLARLTNADAVLDVARTAAEDIRIAFGDYDIQTD